MDRDPLESGERTRDKPWTVRLFGPLRIESEGSVISHFRTQKTAGLFAYLSYHSNRAHPREQLIDLFWPESDLKAGRDSLNKSLSWLRQELSGPDLPLLCDRFTAWIDPSRATTDVEEFLSACRSSRTPTEKCEGLDRLERAEALYGGELLPGSYEAWVTGAQEYLLTTYLKIVKELSDGYLLEGQVDRAIALVERGISFNRWDESLHRHLLRLYAAAGQRGLALDRHRRFARSLKEEWGCDPSGETRSLIEEMMNPAASPTVSAHDSSLTPAPLPRPGEMLAPPDDPALQDLPLPLDSFVGRSREVGEIRSLLRSSRLVMLTGPGGIGKTRLALEVGAVEERERPGGVAWADLSPLTSEDQVIRVLRSSVGLRAEMDFTKEHPFAGLPSRGRLVILDNCEHLIDVCAPLVSALLRACPGVRVLATSRERLRIPGEANYPVMPLTLPPEWDALQTDQREGVAETGAGRLYLDRLRDVSPGFTPTPSALKSVSTICRLLEGIPLALELAAATVNTLSLEETAGRLQAGQPLPRGGRRTAPVRHQSLRSMIEWSYGLLNEGERRLFRRLSVFRGGFTLEALDAVCREESAGGSETLDLLSTLIEKSLLRFDAANRRYVFLETLRGYSLERLEAAGEADMARRRHREYHRAFAENAGGKYWNPDGAGWLERTNQELGNLFLALDHCARDPEGAEDGLRIAAALSHFWQDQGLWREGCFQLQRALGHPGLHETSPARPVALNALGWLQLRLNDLPGAEASFKESLSSARAARRIIDQIAPMTGLASVAQIRGEIETAESYFRRSYDLHRTARPGDPSAEIGWRMSRGSIAAARGDYGEACRWYEECWRLDCENGNEAGDVILALGRAYQGAGEIELARAWFIKGMNAYRGAKGHLQAAMSGMFHLEERGESAAYLLGGIERLQEHLHPGVSIPKEVCARRGRLIRELGRETFEANWRKGWELDERIMSGYTRGGPPGDDPLNLGNGL